MTVSLEVTIDEACSCGATISVTGSRYRHDNNPRNPRGAEEIVERWRTEHEHEFAEVAARAERVAEFAKAEARKCLNILTRVEVLAKEWEKGRAPTAAAELRAVLDEPATGGDVV